MIDISNFNDCIIVCPNAVKEYLLRIKEKEQNIKFLTKKEIISKKKMFGGWGNPVPPRFFG